MSYLAQANALADLEDLAWTAAEMVGRCQGTGLLVSGYRGVIGAALALGLHPAGRGPAWRTDTELVTAVVDLETELNTRLGLVQRMRARFAEVLARLWAAAEKDRNYALIAQLEAAIEVLDSTEIRVVYAARRLVAVPADLGETYAAAYAHVRAGRKLPHNGRWITGTPTTPAA